MHMHLCPLFYALLDFVARGMELILQYGAELK